MIKINKTPDPAFIKQYADDVVDNVIWPRLSDFLKTAPPALAAYFTRACLIDLVSARPEQLEARIDSVYAAFPELAERYCYSLLFAGAKIPFALLPEGLATAAQRQALDDVLDQALRVLRGLLSKYPLVYTRYLAAQLSGTRPRSAKLKFLLKLKAVMAGTHQFSLADRRCFSSWMDGFADCFDFTKVAGKYGTTLCALWDLTVCPYCAVERIEAYARLNMRPELDHFYPRARFPFLAVSLFNLIPSCVICNQKCKRNHPMLGHAHPMLKGFEFDDLFRFGFVPDGNTEQSLDVRILPSTDPQKANNLERFKLAVIYNDNRGLRAWFGNTQSTLNVLREAKVPVSSALVAGIVQSLVDLNNPSSHVDAQAFKVAAVNDLAGFSLRAVEQEP